MPAALNHKCPVRILIVDDNDFGLVARKGVLSELGHEIVTAPDPGKALELCATQNFDLIVTDYKMPVMNGVEFIAQLRKQNKTVPIILLSGFTETLGLSQANTGADIVIQKSSNEVTQLIRAVNRLLKPLKKPVGSQPSALKKARKRAE